MPLPLPHPLLLVSGTLLLLLAARKALRRVDVTVRCAEPLLRRPDDAPPPHAGDREQKGAALLAADAARRYRAALVGSSSNDAPSQSSFRLPGAAPALAPFVVAGSLRGPPSHFSFFASLMCGGAQQLLPSAVDGRVGAEEEAACAKGAATVGCWLSGEVEQLPSESSTAELRIRAVCHRSMWFREAEGSVVFEQPDLGGSGGGGGASAAPPPLFPPPPLRARADVTVRGVPAMLEGAARAAVEQAHARLSRDVATELIMVGGGAARLS